MSMVEITLLAAAVTAVICGFGWMLGMDEEKCQFCGGEGHQIDMAGNKFYSVKCIVCSGTGRRSGK